MLMDYLEEGCWRLVADGVQMCKITAGQLTPGVYPVESGRAEQSGYELFFCLSGSLALERKDDPVMEIGTQEILFTSDATDVQTMVVREALAGYCIAIDPAEARVTFETIYRVLGHGDLCDGWTAHMLRAHDGCIHIPDCNWSRAAFSALCSLPCQEQGHYCVFKIAELIYLLHTHPALLENTSVYLPEQAYSANNIHRVCAYMEEHMDEKLTISELSRQFHLSPTALKNRFREMYGQPIHSWLLHRRVQKAAALLQFSKMTVLQIAQSVGYESVSQFNVVFKRVYGMSPSNYRKMSDTRII